MFNFLSIKNIFNATISRFIIAGFVNTFFTYTMFFLFIEIGLNYVVAVTISTILGILFNFLNFKLFVYKKYNVQNYGLFKFFISYLIQYILNLIGITFLAYLGISYQLAGALMILPLAAFIFIINRVYIFKKE